MKKKYSGKIIFLVAIALSAFIIVQAFNKTGSAKETSNVSANTARAITDNIVNDDNRKAGKWIDSWATSFLSTTVMGVTQFAPAFNNQTLRLNVFTKLGGTKVRVKLTNKFATNTLTVGAAHVALQSEKNSIVEASDRALTFGGQSGITLEPGAEIWSDPVTLTVKQHVTVSISVYVPDNFQPTTFHPTGLHTSYLSATGNFVGASTLPLASTGSITTGVVIVTGLQVWAPKKTKVIICFGNSITDGAASKNDVNGTWPDVLSSRIPVLPSGVPFSVINMGIGSNRIVSSDLAGPSGVHRFAEDVLSRPNVAYLIVMEGINDISYEHATAADITGAYATIVVQAHAKGIKVYGATLLPIGNSRKYTVENEATRQAINVWIRTPGNFDAVLDFEEVVKDPATNPLRIRSEWTGDYVHPNTAGYAAVGNSIPLSLFK